MALPKASEEVFRPSATTRERVADLLAKERNGTLTAEESSELEHYLQLEHIMRLAKARTKHSSRSAQAQ